MTHHPIRQTQKLLSNRDSQEQTESLRRIADALEKIAVALTGAGDKPR